CGAGSMRWPPEPLPLRRVNPLSKLAAALLYIVVATLVFDAGFQLLLLMATVIVLIAFERVDPIMLVKVMAPFALVGFGYLWANPPAPGRRGSVSRVPGRRRPGSQSGRQGRAAAVPAGAVLRPHLLRLRPHDGPGGPRARPHAARPPAGPYRLQRLLRAPVS